VRQRIQKYYRRDSDIIYPPADVDQFCLGEYMDQYFLAGGRLVPYKRFDLIVHVFNRLGWPLKIFGTGPEMDALKKNAKPNIDFLGRVSDADKVRLFAHARGFVHPQVEDLGITPIESMASGTPVIAYGVGGVTETVIPGETGVFFTEQTWESLLEAVLNFDRLQWDRPRIQEYAQKYGADAFKYRMKQYVEDRYEEFLRGMNQCRLDIRV